MIDRLKEAASVERTKTALRGLALVALVATVVLAPIAAIHPTGVGPSSATAQVAAYSESGDVASVQHIPSEGIVVYIVGGDSYAAGSGTIVAYDDESGSQVWSRPTPGYIFAGEEAMDYDSGQGNLLVASGGQASTARVMAVDAATGSVAWNFTSSTVRSVEVDSGSSDVFAFGYDGSNEVIFRIDGTDGTQVTKWTTGDNFAIAVDPEADTVAKTNGYNPTTLDIYDYDGNSVVSGDGDGVAGRYSALIIGPDGNYYASGQNDGYSLASWSPDGTFRYGKALDTNSNTERSLTYFEPNESVLFTSAGDMVEYELDGTAVGTKISGAKAFKFSSESYELVYHDGTTVTSQEYERPSSGSSYRQEFVLDDRSGLFPRDRSTLSVYSWDPGAKSLDSPTESEEWSVEESTTFNSEAKAYADLVDGDYYKISVTRGGNSWAVLRYRANDSDTATTLSIDESPLVEETTTPTATPTPRPTLTPYANGSTPTPYPTLTATEEPSAEGPAVLGRCEVSGEGGIEVEYWDPSYSTASLDYNLTGPDGGVYAGSLSWEEPRGYYRGCIATNGTAPEDVDGEYSGDYTNGTSYNGSLEWPDTSGGFLAGGPTGSGGGGSTATQYGGYVILLGGAALAYRRFGNGQIGALLSTASERLAGLVGR